jgi:hypothetical protein
MPNRTQDKIYETFVAVSGGHWSSHHSMIDASERIAKPGSRTGSQIRTARPVTWRANERVTPIRPAGSTSATSASDTTARSFQSAASTALQSIFQGVPVVGAVAGASNSAGGGGIGHTIESLASTVLKSGLGMIPLMGGLLGLFGGGGSPAPAALTKYVMPSSIAFEGADTGPGIRGADFDQTGMPRALGGGGVGAPQTGSIGSAGNGSDSAGLTSATLRGKTGETPTDGSIWSSGGINAEAPQNTVDAQAMDARWFLDHSADIASAVRYAMLNSNSINDVVNEL